MAGELIDLQMVRLGRRGAELANARSADFECHLRHGIEALAPEQRLELEEWIAARVPGFERFFAAASTFGVDR